MFIVRSGYRVFNVNNKYFLGINKRSYHEYHDDVSFMFSRY